MKKLVIVIMLLIILAPAVSAEIDGEVMDEVISIFNHHGSPMLLIDQQTGEIIFANDAARNFYGYSESEILSMNINEINTLTEEEINEEMSAAVREERNFFEFEHRLADGETRNVEVYSYLIEFQEREVLFSIVNDVTPRVMMEERNKRINQYLYLSFIAIILILLISGVFLLKDRRKLKKQKDALENFNKLKETFIDADDSMEYLKDNDYKYIFVNKATAEFYNKSKEEIVGIDDYELTSKEFADIRRRTDEKTLEKGELITEEVTWKEEIFEVRKFPVELLDGSYGVGAYIRNVTEEYKKNAEIKYLSYRDHLTGLYNRRFFEEEVKRLDTSRHLPISIIMADINGLKIINDSFGHDEGDKLLIKVSDILKSSVRQEDVLARYGGDDFIILLPNTDNKNAEKVLKRINKERKKADSSKFPVSISLGLATKTDENQDINEIIKEADDKMYQNKLMNNNSSKRRIVASLLETLSTKSDETKEHAMRMTKLAYKIGEKLDLSSSEINRLSLLASLHDIGKIIIPEEILIKPGKLNNEEWELIGKHPKVGYEIASASKEFAIIAEEILAHHEKWDGTGYPNGLKNEDIPYLARIISVIDAYDVMTNDRPYSKAISKEKALKEIKACAGIQFDPEIANEFIEMLT